MCGIVGYIGDRSVLDVVAKGLKRLEYRGYDSAGIAYFSDDRLQVVKSEGKLEQLVGLIQELPPKARESHSGMGHTRWATHGKPTTQNAHPHRIDHVVIVHNGIIENYQEIRADLMSRGHAPVSETDSELFGFLVFEEMAKGKKLLPAVRTAFLELKGACSVVVMSEREPGVVIGVRNGSPLVAAQDPQGGAIIASDAQPIVEYTKSIYYLENGDIVVGSKAGVSFCSLATGEMVHRTPVTVDWSSDQLDKQGYPHFMLKEIFEQPTALIDTLNTLVDRKSADPFPMAHQPGVGILKSAKNLIVVACGTSYHSALLGKYWLEKWARIPVQVEIASEFRYRHPILPEGSVILGITQSGETADTLAVIREMKTKGVPTLAVTNVRGSTISREANAVFYTSAGPEIGVAATKTFLAQLLALLVISGFLHREWYERATEDGDSAMMELFQEVVRLPHALKQMLEGPHSVVDQVIAVAGAIQHAKGYFFMGRGYCYPIALEAALKLKEIAYVHAEGHAAGELKHGPIAMIDPDVAVIVLAPEDQWRDKTVSNLEEVKARGARILGVGSEKDTALQKLCDYWIPIPEVGVSEPLLPFLVSPVIQLLSYYSALLKGTDIDQPRNLAKSVTVE